MVGLKQEFRQAQQLVMTQQLQQSIKLLQLSNQELQAFIEEEVEKNPLLQQEDGSSETIANADISERDDGYGLPTERGEGARQTDTYEQSEGNLYGDGHNGEDEISNAFTGEIPPSANDASHNYSAGERSGYRSDTDSEGMRLEERLANSENLHDVLSSQIAMEFASPAQRVLAVSMIDFLDDAGYFREEPEHIAKQFGVDEDMVLSTLQGLQNLEPSGIFARDLPECLRLQLQDRNRYDPIMATLLDNLSLMGDGRHAELQRLCGVDDEDFAQMLADIKQCNPKPAGHYNSVAAQTVVPDVLVRRGPDNSWLIELNQDALPRVLIRKEYAAQVGGSADKKAKKYVNEQLANAGWLIKALDQRAQTILKVSEEIIKKQDMFLMHGIRFLKPLILRDIADAIGMHESTVSRVTNNKFIATPRGTLELKYFFTSSIGAATGDVEFSSKTVMYYIKEVIDAEAADNILSDDAIVSLLKRRNINVARRTVTKYREALNLPSSVMRRRQKRTK